MGEVDMATHDSTAAESESLLSARHLSLLQRRWGWLLLLGLVQIACGALALAVPVAASLAAVIVFGAVLVVAGVFQAVHAFSVRTWKGVVLQGLGALLYIAAGVLILLFPLSGALSLTIVVAALLIADGVARCVLAYRLKPLDGWGWFLGAGIASTVVGILLMVGWPLTGLFAIGLLLGVNLIFAGVTNCALAVTFRTLTHRDSEHDSMHGAHHA
jgi:uncharacterized membrane protein HdeD (DUF308 family)